MATFSPDGRWIACVSDENQQPQVYVRSFPDGEFKAQLSTAGGSQPQWRRDGRELFYIAPDNTMISTRPSPDDDAIVWLEDQRGFRVQLEP